MMKSQTSASRVVFHLLALLTLAGLAFTLRLAVSTNRDASYELTKVVSGKAVIGVSGKIRKRSSLYINRSHKNLSVKISGVNKWVRIKDIDSDRKLRWGYIHRVQTPHSGRGFSGTTLSILWALPLTASQFEILTPS